jgi:hypothetical protein
MGKKALLGAAAFLVGVSASSMASAGWQAYFIENYTGNVATGTAWTQNQSHDVFVGDIPLPYFSEYTDSNSVTIGQWLASGGVHYSGTGANDPMNNTLWLFYTDGSFSHAPNVTIVHDDGVEGRWQHILGTVYSGFTSGGTPPIAETGTCPGCTGSGQFGFVYNEAFGGPAVAQVISVPELSTWAMMGLGFAGLAFAGYRTRRAATSIA